MSAVIEADRKSVAAAVERIAPVIEAHRDEGELGRRLPDGVVRAMLDEELFSLWTAREYGGAEVSLPTFMTVVESISRIDAASGWVFANLAAGGILAAHTPESAAR